MVNFVRRFGEVEDISVIFTSSKEIKGSYKTFTLKFSLSYIFEHEIVDQAEAHCLGNMYSIWL